MKLILASASKNRCQALQSLNVTFQVVASRINESSVGENHPVKRARLLAKLKGEAILKKTTAIVIAADTFTICQGKILEKPKSETEAKAMLYFISNQQTTNHTGLYYHDPYQKFTYNRTIITQVKFRQFYPDEIDAYIKKFPVTSWAAAYAASELYIKGMIKTIRGSLTGLTHALPLEVVIPLLKRSGIIFYP